jgi:hypothetical protein
MEELLTGGVITILTFFVGVHGWVFVHTRRRRIL